MLLILREWPAIVFILYQLYTLHKAIVISLDVDAKYSKFGEKTTVTTQLECPVSFLISFPVNEFHTLIVLSLDPEAKYSPFGENATQVISEE